MRKRTALLIYCCREDAQKIRERATQEHRTVSGYVLNVLLRKAAFEETLHARLGSLGISGVSRRPSVCPPGPKTTLLLRCSAGQAQQVRAAARRRGVSISGFVRDALRRSWNAETQNPPVVPPPPVRSAPTLSIWDPRRESRFLLTRPPARHW